MSMIGKLLSTKAKAVLTETVGTAFLDESKSRMGSLLKNSERALSHLADDLDVMSRKDYTAENIGALYRKHRYAPNGAFKKVFENTEQKINIPTSNGSAIAAIIKREELKANADVNLKKNFNVEYSKLVTQRLKNKYKIDAEESRRVGKLVQSTVEKNNLIKLENSDEIVKLNDDVINSFLKETDLQHANRNDFFSDLISEVRDNKEVAWKKYKEEKGQTLNNEIVNLFNPNNMADKYGVSTNKGSLPRGMTFGDFLDNIDKFEDKVITINEKESISVKDTIKKFAEENQEIKDILIDAKNLKIKNNEEIMDMSAFDEYQKVVKRKYAGTLPGKLSKMTDRMSANDPDMFNFLYANKTAHLIGEEGLAKDNYVQVLGKFYKINEDHSLERMSKFDDMYTLSSKHGTTPRLLNKMFGTESRREATNKWTKLFNVNTSNESNVIDDLTQRNGYLGKKARGIFGGEKYNIIDKINDDNFRISEKVEYRENAFQMNHVFASITHAPSLSTIRKLSEVTKNDFSIEILKAIETNNADEIINRLTNNLDELKNKDLKNLLKTGTRDREKAAKMLSITSTDLTSKKRIDTFKEMLKKEAFKEAMINEAIYNNGNSKNHIRIIETIEKANISNQEKENAKKIAHWSTMQFEGKLFSADKNLTVEDDIDHYNNALATLFSVGKSEEKLPINEKYINGFDDTIKDIKRNYTDLTSRIENRERPGVVVNKEESNDVVLMRKAYTLENYILDMVKDINDTTKMRADTKRFGMQFIAGKNSKEYVTTYTMIPYALTERLIEPFNKFGLGFTGDDMSSVGSQWKAILGKRVLPAALGLTAASYINFEAKNLTGTSLTGAFAQGIANTDLGIRKIADATGIGGLLNAERGINPITQYWFGKDYQDSNERKDYYVNGYDAMRKGRWWAFGSAGEFRGGKIAYFQPNFVKRANSDWKDIGLYGSVDEKWKHSWIPTLRHPLSPIRRLLDPYWLEKKHYWDRPYMQTGTLFTEGTPWGAVLNPTLGQAIKPIRQMHRQESRWGELDPRMLIQQRNERLKARARDKNRENLFQIGQDGITNMKYVPKALADPSKMMLTFAINEDGLKSVNYNGLSYSDNVTPSSDVNISVNKNVNIEASIVPENKGNQNIAESAIEKVAVTKIGSFIANKMSEVTGGSNISTIANINSGIKKRANIAANGAMLQKVNLASMPAKQAAERMITADDVADLKLTSSNYNFINDSLFAGKQLTGAYGFIAGLLGGNENGKRVKVQNANQMYSFKTGFWDANIGGAGGGIMEIARRFFPHADHSFVEINNIKNTMPDWMPVRFQTGDPFRKLPKGEMRLPGAGYESIHKLRPDAYGKYGALDRMSILADIAPWSDEYKIWRDIAQKEYKDPKSKKEISDIKKRVQEQSKSHDFFEYNFLGKGTKLKDITVQNVEGSTFTSTEGKTYSLAGIKLGKGADINSKLASGMRVQVEYLKNQCETKGPINSAVYVNGENLNKELLKDKQATKKDRSDAMDVKALTGTLGSMYGGIMEGIAHAPIPFVHSKILRIETPLESYKNERVYGTPYSTWEHPIKGFIEPALQKSWARGPIGQGVAIGGWMLAEHMWANSNAIHKKAEQLGYKLSETAVNKTASVIMNTLNPGAFTFNMMAAIPTGLMGDSDGFKGLVSAGVFGTGVERGIGRNSARLGAAVMLAGYGITRSANPIKATASFSLAGIALSKQLAHEKFSTGKGAIAGAAVGLALSALRNPGFDKEKMFGNYTPKSTKKRRDIDEYYDRLEYIKWMGLYEKASRKAKMFEHTNIKKIIEANEYTRKDNEKKIEHINKRLKKISNSNLNSSLKEELSSKLKTQLYDLNYSKQMLRGGKYTKAAIAYKQAADSTIYGLSENSSIQQVLRAIPKSEKDYFMEFAKERNRSKRKKILKYVSPYERKALQIMWGEKAERQQSNKSYFTRHFMPGVFWAGWKPQVDLSNVKIKTIQNEGMLLSDFGVYESQANEPDAIMAPSIGTFDKSNAGGIGMRGRLESALNGVGLLGVKVSVSPSSSNGIEVLANITNAAKITEYKLKQGMNKVIGTRMFY